MTPGKPMKTKTLIAWKDGGMTQYGLYWKYQKYFVSWANGLQLSTPWFYFEVLISINGEWRNQ